MPLVIKNDNNKLKKLLFVLDLKKSELKEVESLSEKYLKSFQFAVYDYCVSKKLPFIKHKIEDREEMYSSNNINISSNIKKIYREIVSMTHPDKHKYNLDPAIKNMLMDNFLNATKSIKKGYISEILNIAKKLDINIDCLELSDLAFLYEEIDFLNKKIKECKNTYSWKWNETKNNMWIKEYIKIKSKK